jgi:multidrug efflux pump subunit AcrA (membrane-fusion protein)
MSWDRKVAFVVFVGLLVYLPFFFFGGKGDELAENTNLKQVETARVSDLSNLSTPLSLVGVVESVSEATVRAESSGQLTRVYKKLGDRVYAGEVIATFDNAGERAAVLQAEGAYEQAKAARDLSNVNLNNSNSGNSLESAKATALNAISSSYISMDDAVRAKTDIAFSNPRTDVLRFLPLAPDQVLLFKIETERKEIEKMLVQRDNLNKTLTINSDLETELTTALNELNTVKNYLDDLARVYSIAIPNGEFTQASIDAQKSIVSGMRSAVSGSISSVNGAKLGLQSAKNGNNITTDIKNPTQAQGDASVKIALGAYQGALARLNKTIVRSSISGTINSLTVKTGDYATPSQTIAVVSNNNALLVTTYITPEDSKKVIVGGEVLVNGKIPAVVTRVASAIDTLTKKIKIEIGFKNENQSLTNGQSVRIEIAGLGETKVVKKLDEKIKIPLSSVKMTPRGSFVFMVVDGKLSGKEVSIGALTGDEVEILSGITVDDVIVKDARGLKDGQEVQVKG